MTLFGLSYFSEKKNWSILSVTHKTQTLKWQEHIMQYIANKKIIFSKFYFYQIYLIMEIQIVAIHVKEKFISTNLN